MMELKNGKIYLGHTYNTTYIGKYNEKTKSLNEVWAIHIKGSNIEIIPAIHPAFLQKKFENKLVDVNISTDKFITLSDPDVLEFGEDLIKVFIEATSGVIIEGGKDEQKPKLSEKEIAERIKKATEEKAKEAGLKIIQS